MQVNLRIEEDAQFRDYVKNMIAGEVRAILRGELNGIVHAELAKMRLTDPDAPAMKERIDKYVEDAMKNKLNIQAMAQNAVTQQVRAATAEGIRDFRQNLIDTFKREVSKLV